MPLPRSEKTLARSSNGWYIGIWATASAAMIGADMVVRGVTFLDFFPAMLSIVFAVAMFSGKRAEDRVIARYQELPPRDGRTTTIPLTTRYELLGLLEKSLWALWGVLLACSLAFPIIGDRKLSDAFNIGMIVLCLTAAPIRMFTAAALFWPGRKSQRDGSAEPSPVVGCGGSQPPIGAPGSMPQTSAIAMHADRGGSR